MNNIQETLLLAERLTKKGFSYKKRLLRKFDTKNQFDAEQLSYVVDGGKPGYYIHFLGHLVKNSDAKLILELGNRYGSSTLAMYSGLQKNQKLVTVDIERDQRYVPEEVFADERVEFVFGDCIDLQSFTTIPIDIDILFTDTIHTDEQLRAEWSVYEPLLANEAIFIIDDIHLNDKIKLFNDLKFNKKNLQLFHGNGFGIIHYIRPEEERGKTKEERIIESSIRATSIWHDRYKKLNNNAYLLTKAITTILIQKSKKKYNKIKKDLQI